MAVACTSTRPRSPSPRSRCGACASRLSRTAAPSATHCAAPFVVNCPNGGSLALPTPPNNPCTGKLVLSSTRSAGGNRRAAQAEASHRSLLPAVCEIGARSPWRCTTMACASTKSSPGGV
eukprot:scaffold30002_cov69-Phaeocystis_antarctica.AAC.4